MIETQISFFPPGEEDQISPLLSVSTDDLGKQTSLFSSPGNTAFFSPVGLLFHNIIRDYFLCLPASVFQTTPAEMSKVYNNSNGKGKSLAPDSFRAESVLTRPRKEITKQVCISCNQHMPQTGNSDCFYFYLLIYLF